MLGDVLVEGEMMFGLRMVSFYTIRWLLVRTIKYAMSLQYGRQIIWISVIFTFLWNCVWKKSLCTALDSWQNEVDSTNLDSGQVEGGCRRALNTLPHSWSPSCRGPYPVQRSTFSIFSQRFFGICGNKYYSPSSSEGLGPIRRGCQSFSSENLFSSSRLFVLFSSSFSPSHSLPQSLLLAGLPTGD